MTSRLADIAARSGVSTATVSRVLNGREGVSAATKEAVLVALDVLGYERPALLRNRTNGLVGLVVPELDNPIFPMLSQTIQAGLIEHGYTPLLCTRTPGGVTEEEYIELLGRHGVSGIIFVSGIHADSTADLTRYRRLRTSGLPLVFINGYAEGIDATFISCDDEAAVDLAVRYLASMGHQRIGLAIGPHRFVPAARKISGFERVTRTIGVTGEIAITLFSVEGGHAAAQDLLDRGCTAIVTGSDLMALGAIKFAGSRGLSVPGDLSVVGFDDSALMAYTAPPLTTVRQPVAAMGAAATTALIDEINGRTGPRTELRFAPELIVRGSAGPVRAAVSRP